MEKLTLVREPNEEDIKRAIENHKMRNQITTNFAHSIAPELMMLQTDMRKTDCKRLAVKFQAVLKSMYTDPMKRAASNLIKFRKTVETSTGNNNTVKAIAISKIDKTLEEIHND